MGRLLLVAMLLGSVAGSPGLGQDAPLRVGEKVVTKDRTPLTDGGREVDDDSNFRVYIVEKVDGQRLLLASGEVRGYVPAASVVAFDRAIDYFTEELRKNPKWVFGLNKRGVLWNEKREFDRALADFDLAVKLNPDSFKAYLGRANVLRQKREFGRAVADYNEAMRLDPRDPAAYVGRGNVWQDQGDHVKAVADYNEAIRLDPKFALAYCNRGNSRYFQGDPDAAIPDYDEAIRLDPKDDNTYICRGNAWGVKREYAKVVADYEAAIRLAPRNAAALHLVAQIRASCYDPKVRDGKKAVDAATRANELRGWEDPVYLSTLAAAYAEAGNFEKAVRWQTEANRRFVDDEGKREGEKRLRLYKDKKPLREPESAPAGEVLA